MARAYRRARPTTTPAESLRRLVDEHLADAPGRAPQRPAWDALTRAQQLDVVHAAFAGAAVDDWRAWLAGLHSARPLVGAIVWTLGAHAAWDHA